MASSDDPGGSRLDLLTAFLADPATHGLGGSVERIEGPIETHGAVVILAGDRAYKIKKPVALPYMDLSTLARRRRICRREVEINRRTAPDLYLGVGAVVVGRDGRWRLRGPDAPSVKGERLVEPVVVMRRFDGEALFDRLAETGRLADRDLDALAAAVAAAHAAAPRRRSRPGSRRVQDVLAINRAGLLAGVPAVLDAEAASDLVARTAVVAGELGARLDARGRRGRVRRCHGDLHLRNVFRAEDGHPVLFDALEFDEDLATVDVAYDLAFLLMDLRHRGLAAGANRVWNGWLSASGDNDAAAALPLFLSMRAAVRAHVGATAATQHGLDRDRAEDARRYLQEARGYLDTVPPVVLAIGGISGTGKSTLARAVAAEVGRAPGAVVLRSDVIRKRMFGAEETDRLPAEAYEPVVSRRVFATIHRRARRLARLGASAVADAVYGRPQDRDAVAATARLAGAGFLGVWLELPAHQARARVSARTGDASDATSDIVDRQAESISAPQDWLRLDAGRPVADLAAVVIAAARGR